MGIEVKPLRIDLREFNRFKEEFVFPKEYFQGKPLGHKEEKLLEHFIAYKLGSLKNIQFDKNIYIDIAASSSPWAKVLRSKGYIAYAIDIERSVVNKHLDYYKEMDAKKTTYKDASIQVASLQCSFEMFSGEDDVLFIDECARVLKSGGKLIISPLYLHTHYCGYSTPEYYNKGYADSGSTEYIRKDCWGVPFSRKYDAVTLKRRLLQRIDSKGMTYHLYKIINKKELEEAVYCHFILEVIR
jgi:predicted SAM-dependent methyltransferase